MAVSREVLRQQAKKIYKEQTKSVPKRNRISFSEFFKKYRKNKKDGQPTEVQEPNTEDIDFEDLINVNEISDENLETEEDK